MFDYFDKCGDFFFFSQAVHDVRISPPFTIINCNDLHWSFNFYVIYCTISYLSDQFDHLIDLYRIVIKKKRVKLYVKKKLPGKNYNLHESVV